MNQKNFYEWVMAAFKKHSRSLPALLFMSLVLTEPAFAGLEKGRQTFEEIKDWIYIMLGIGVFVYVMYHVIMAMFQKMQWSDVFISVAYSALAGAVVVLTTWAWGIWGT